MYKIMGNSPERVPITDLRDVIYYKQVKDYSDQEYHSSKDLQRALARNYLVILEHYETPRGSGTVPVNGSESRGSGLTVDDLKRVMQEFKQENSAGDVRRALQDLIPTLLSMVRQEMSSISVGTVQKSLEATTKFIGPEFVPSIRTDDMVGNIKLESKAVVDNVTDNLAALKKFKNLNNK